jgi:hypothetical protein
MTDFFIKFFLEIFKGNPWGVWVVVLGWFFILLQDRIIYIKKIKHTGPSNSILYGDLGSNKINKYSIIFVLKRFKIEKYLVLNDGKVSNCEKRLFYLADKVKSTFFEKGPKDFNAQKSFGESLTVSKIFDGK